MQSYLAVGFGFPGKTLTKEEWEDLAYEVEQAGLKFENESPIQVWHDQEEYAQNWSTIVLQPISIWGNRKKIGSHADKIITSEAIEILDKMVDPSLIQAELKRWKLEKYEDKVGLVIYMRDC